MNESAPRLRGKVYVDQYNVRIRPETKRAIYRLKAEFNIDTAELFRKIVEQETERLLAECERAG
jgi:hypothetical protein